MGNSCSPGWRWWCDCVFLCYVLDEILDLIESVSEGFLTNSLMYVYLPVHH